VLISDDAKYTADPTRLDGGIDQCQYLVGDLINFNRDQWPVRYPCLGPAQAGNVPTGKMHQQLYLDRVLTTKLHLRDPACHDGP